MVITMAAMSMILATAALSVSVVATDQPIAREDVNRKSAFAAAESGLQVYVHRLLSDNAYWAQCEDEASGLNLAWDGTGTDPRNWKSLTANSGWYTIESLPAKVTEPCDPDNPEETMIGTLQDGRTPTFRVRITGQASGATGQRVGPRRSLIATFKRRSFLDYIYFTDLEVLDPDTYESALAGGRNTRETGTGRTIAQWGASACSKQVYITGEGGKKREAQQFNGQAQNSNGSWSNYSAKCQEIQFAGDDYINGPMHTNDIPQICGRPSFGREPAERIEISGPNDPNADYGDSYRRACNDANPRVNQPGQNNPISTLGTWYFNQEKMLLPATNNSLQAEAPKAATFVGETRFRFEGGRIWVIGTDAAGKAYNNEPMNYPANGVLYVKTDRSCPKRYQTGDPQDTLVDRKTCGIAWVKGQYTENLTLAAEDDIRIDGNITRTGAKLLGLIATNFIRVHHPVSSARNCSTGDNNIAPILKNLQIDAALLTLQHSFLVDNWKCGGDLGKLTVNGAIAQKYRGPVATTGGTGYDKNYVYDNNLRVLSPPKFLDPVESSWKLHTFQEQVPAR